MLLVNKSDFLTAEQIHHWTEYFRANNIYAVFFSAHASSGKLPTNNNNPFVCSLPSVTETENSVEQSPENSVEKSPENSVEQIPENSVEQIPENPVEQSPENAFEQSPQEVDDDSFENPSDNSFEDDPPSGATDSRSYDTAAENLSDSEDLNDSFQSSDYKNEGHYAPPPAEPARQLVTEEKVYNREELIALLKSLCPPAAEKVVIIII